MNDLEGVFNNTLVNGKFRRPVEAFSCSASSSLSRAYLQKKEIGVKVRRDEKDEKKGKKIVAALTFGSSPM